MCVSLVGVFGGVSMIDFLLLVLLVLLLSLLLLLLGRPKNQILIPDWTYLHCPGATQSLPSCWRIEENQDKAPKTLKKIGCHFLPKSFFLCASPPTLHSALFYAHQG